MKRAKVSELEPLYVSWDEAARLSGIPKKTLQNMRSTGQLPLVIRYVGRCKPLIEFTSLRVWLESLPTEPEHRRGRRPQHEG